jgi:integrase
LFDAAEPHLKDCIVALLETGMRKGELLSLQWKHVRWLQNEVLVEWANTKTKTSRKIPLSPTARDLLSRPQRDYLAILPKPFNPSVSDAERLSGLYVFGNAIGERIGDIKTAWTKTCERAKIDDLHIHDLRREAGSRKLEGFADQEPWPLNAVSKWLGHANVTMTAAYLHADDNFLHQLNERPRPILVK